MIITIILAKGSQNHSSNNSSTVRCPLYNNLWCACICSFVCVSVYACVRMIVRAHTVRTTDSVP